MPRRRVGAGCCGCQPGPGGVAAAARGRAALPGIAQVVPFGEQILACRFSRRVLASSPDGEQSPSPTGSPSGCRGGCGNSLGCKRSRAPDARRHRSPWEAGGAGKGSVRWVPPGAKSSPRLHLPPLGRSRLGSVTGPASPCQHSRVMPASADVACSLDRRSSHVALVSLPQICSLCSSEEAEPSSELP